MKNPTPSVNVYLREEHSCQISSQSDLKQQEEEQNE